VIALFAFFLIVSLVLALRKPTYFVIFYLLATTRFLGFFDVEYYFVIGGVGLGMPMLNIITLLASFFRVKWYKFSKKFLIFTAIYLLFVLYGIIYPVTQGYESITQAIISSKEFWTISTLFYLVSRKRKIDVQTLIKTMQFIGVYLALIYIFYLLFKTGPPFYTEENHVRGYFPTYISMALFIYYIQFQNKQIKLKKFIVIGMILVFGLVLTEYFALIVGTVFSLLILFLFYSKTKSSVSRLFKRSIVLICITFVVLVSSSTLRNTGENKIIMIISGTDASLTARDNYNEFRWEAIAERPLIGYGFIHKSAPVSIKFKIIENNRYAESFGVVDSGFVDLIIKFGYIGMSIYLLLWASLILPVLFKPKNYDYLQLGLSAFLLQYFFISYTWSVFSFSHGLIPAFISIFIILFQQSKKRDKVYTIKK
jgi:O-antigen ligase